LDFGGDGKGGLNGSDGKGGSGSPGGLNVSGGLKGRGGFGDGEVSDGPLGFGGMGAVSFLEISETEGPEGTEFTPSIRESSCLTASSSGGSNHPSKSSFLLFDFSSAM